LKALRRHLMTAFYPEHDTQPFVPVRPPAISPWLIRLPILFGSGAVLLILVLTILVGLFQIAFRDRIIPGVSAYGLNLSGMRIDQAISALDARFTYPQDAVFTLRDGDRFWQFSAGELGVTFDAQATAVEAFAIGHSGNPILDLIDQTLTWVNGHTVSPIVRYDQASALAQLERIAGEINRPARDARLVIDGLRIEAEPGQSGRTLDLMATLNRLDNAIVNLSQGGEIPIAVRESAPVAWDAEGAARKARVALSAPIVLVADDGRGGALGPWTASVDQIAQLLQIETIANGDGSFSYDVTVNLEAYRPALEQLAAGLIIAPQNARFRFDSASGQLINTQAAINGRRLNIPQTLARMEQAIFSADNRIVPLAFDYELPRYHNDVTAAELGITEMIAQGTTYYTGSTQARRENIAISVARFDGIIIGPQEVFSFNQWIGDITPEEGFVSSAVIVGDRTVDGVGGGICQVSTTVFQAAFYAGYPIIERWAHSYRVIYYEAGEGVGMDAAVYKPDLDFRFLNDTDYHLLIEASILPGSNAVQFRFYSTNPGRQVVKQGPVIRDVRPPAPTRYEVNPQLVAGQELQVDWAAEGAYVEVTRIILDSNGNEIRRDRIASQYQPWGAIVQVPPGDPRLRS
jgi:vancomycin resistance protein YoaR